MIWIQEIGMYRLEKWLMKKLFQKKRSIEILI
jgi:hypothetical protein